MTDGELLQLYAANGDGEAFAELVRRHGGMVHATARRLARDEAEDVTQAVFLLLARKARKLSRYRNLAGWLYNVTRYCAANACRTRGRREKHLENYQQQEAAMRQSSALTEGDASVSELLDAALARLKEDQRQAVLLRYIEGLTLDEAAVRLGINAAAVAKRAERGVTRLREYFAARGVTLSDAALAATPISAPMLTSLSELAAGAAPAANGAAIATAAAKSMMLTAAAKVAAVVALAAAGVTATVGVTGAFKSPAPKPAQAAATTTSVISPAATAPAAALTQETGRALATQFARALSNRDEDALARLAPGDTPAARRDYAIGLIAQVVDGLYNRFPQRLENFPSSSFSTDARGPMEMTLIAAPPTIADVRSFAIVMRPVDGQWRVVETKLTTVELGEIRLKQPITPGNYAKAAEIYARFEGRMTRAPQGEMTDADRVRALDSLAGTVTDVAQLAEALRSTDLAISDDDVEVVQRWSAILRDAYKTGGAAAFDARRNDARLDMDLSLVMNRLQKIGDELSTRADDASAPTSPGTRPPPFAPDIELTLAWDGSKQKIRGPVKVPPWFRESQAFKSWQRRHTSQTLRTRDDEGNVYEIYCSGAVNRDGKTYEWLPTVRMFRPDGTLAAQASYNEVGQPTAWAEYGSTGKKKVFSVNTNGIAITEVPPPIMLVAFYDEQENQRVWHVSSKDPTLVQVEMLNNPIGEKIRVLHAARERKTKQTTTTTTKMTTKRAK